MNHKVWKKIELGQFDTVQHLKDALVDHEFRIGDWANDVLDNNAFEPSNSRKEINLLNLTVKDLGFYSGAYRSEIYEKAKEAGLEICPAEVGPMLRLAYKDQPHLESLQIGMEPQKDSTGHESEFRVVHSADGHLFLAGDHKHPNDFWEPDERFIFVLP